MIKITLKTATAEVGEHDAVIVRGLDAAVICNETPDTARNLERRNALRREIVARLRAAGAGPDFWPMDWIRF